MLFGGSTQFVEGMLFGRFLCVQMRVDILFYDCTIYIHPYLLPGVLGIITSFEARSLSGIGPYHASDRVLAFNRRVLVNVSG